MDYLQQQPGLVLAELEQQPFVDDEERRLGVLLQRVFEGVPVFRGGLVHQQFTFFIILVNVSEKSKKENICSFKISTEQATVIVFANHG